MAKKKAEKVEKKVVEKKAPQPKNFQMVAIVNVTHRGKVYQKDEMFDEEDPEMVKQLVDKKLARKV